ncbi:marvel domain-containing protein [Phaeosphaeria sp. MPI-PUGE-AT-0046c]|nr:marvel domain-containing protein [Phaeosphaeria sp. MPI-PUGE-AT-0046c]
MPSRTYLWISTITRGLQILFGIVVLGLSATLAEDHYAGTDAVDDTGAKKALSSVPFVLPWTSAVGALTFIAGGVNIFIAWTEYFGAYIEMLIDIVIIFANVVGGTLLAVRVKGKNCDDETSLNQIGEEARWPYTGSLAAVDIFCGACYEYSGGTWCANASEDRLSNLNKRCKQSGTDSVFVWMTVLFLLVTLTLTCLRLKNNR